MRRYFRRVRDSLTDDGVFFLDATAATTPSASEGAHGVQGFTYIWDQASYNRSRAI